MKTEETKEKEFIITCNLYYDKYEKEFGDGFYPQLKLDINKSYGIINNSYGIINISFKLIDNDTAWIQMNGPVIMGFDGTNGLHILILLNSQANIQFPTHIQISATKIYNCAYRLIYPKQPDNNSTYRLIKQDHHPS